MTTAPRIWDKHCKSLCFWNFLSCLTSYISLKRKFFRQASRQCQRALDPHTDWRARCHCLFVAWLHLKCWLGLNKSCHHSTRQPRRWPKRSSTLQDPRKRLWTFFFRFESATASCVSSGDLNLGAYIQLCLLHRSRPVSAEPELGSRSHNRNTGAVLVQRAVQLSHVKREVQRRQNKLGTEALRTILLGSTVLSRDWWFFFFKCAHAEREKEREREREDRTYRWRKFRFQWPSQRSEERKESLEVQVRGAWSGKAHRSVSTSLELTERVFPAVYF